MFPLTSAETTGACFKIFCATPLRSVAIENAAGAEVLPTPAVRETPYAHAAITSDVRESREHDVVCRQCGYSGNKTDKPGQAEGPDNRPKDTLCMLRRERELLNART